MSFLEISNKLFQWFSQNDTFTLEDNFKDVVLLTENKDKDSAVVLAALKEYTELKIIERIDVNNKTYWVLKRPFAALDQSVRVPAVLANEIALLINAISENIDEDIPLCDVRNIAEQDIFNLVMILKNFLTAGEDDNQEGDEENGDENKSVD